MCDQDIEEFKVHCNQVSGGIMSKLTDFINGWNIWKDEHKKESTEQREHNDWMRMLVTDHETKLYGHGPNKDGGMNEEVKGLRAVWPKLASLKVLFSVGVLSIVALVITTIINMMG